MSRNQHHTKGDETLGDITFSRETEQTVAADHAARAIAEPGTVHPHDRLPEEKIETDGNDMPGTTGMYHRMGKPRD